MTVLEEDVHDRDSVRQGGGDAARQHHMSPPRSDKLPETRLFVDLSDTQDVLH